MKVDVRIESEDLKGALRTYIQRRLHFTLGRFGEKLGRVRVRVQMSRESASSSTRHAIYRRSSSPQSKSSGWSGRPKSLYRRRSCYGNVSAALWSGPWSPPATPAAS